MKKKITSKNDDHELVTRGWLRAEINPRFDDLQQRFEKFSALILEELRLNREERRQMHQEYQQLYQNDLRQELAIDALEQRVLIMETSS